MSYKYPQQQWLFSAFDTWFFRDARPFESVSGNELTSVFPPPARTIMGVIRSMIGEFNRVDWEKDLKKEAENNLGKIEITESCLIYDKEPLYPIPYFLLKNESEYVFLEIKEENIVECDLGTIVLPKLSKRGAKSIENCWLTQKGLEKLLKWQMPNDDDFLPRNDKNKIKKLFMPETHVGIGRDVETKIVEEGKLFTTKQIRIDENLKVGVLVDFSDIPSFLNKKMPVGKFQTRFGGEGRMASVEISDVEISEKLTIPKIANLNLSVKNNSKNLLIILLTPADFNGDWLPKESEYNGKYNSVMNFTKDPNKPHVWCGCIHGIHVEIITAVIGKSMREGGWDLMNKRPRDVRSLVPAGSAYFCRITDDKISLQDAIKKLQGLKIGEKTFLGYGKIAVGEWK